MKKIAVTLASLVLAFSLSGCTTDDQDPSPDAGPACGARPLAPGWAATYDQGRAIIEGAQYQALYQWTEEIRTWSSCAEPLLTGR